MKRSEFAAGVLILSAGLSPVPAMAADVGFGVNLNIGNMPPAPVYAPAPVYVPPPVVVAAPPMFIAPPSLGVSIAVGVPYDMFMVSGSYYVYKGDRWYCGPRYGGPWRVVAFNQLPPQLRRHGVKHYRQVRDREYQTYRHNRDDYRGRYYQAGNEGGGRPHDRGRHGDQVAWRDGGSGERRHGGGHGRD